MERVSKANHAVGWGPDGFAGGAGSAEAAHRARALPGKRMEKLSHYTFVLLLTLGASGCLDFSGTGGEVMSIELCWNETPGAGTFKGKNCANTNAGTCERA